MPWAADQSYHPPPPDDFPQTHPLPTTQPGGSPVLLAPLKQEPNVDTLQPKDSAAEPDAEPAGSGGRGLEDAPIYRSRDYSRNGSAGAWGGGSSAKEQLNDAPTTQISFAEFYAAGLHRTNLLKKKAQGTARGDAGGRVAGGGVRAANVKNRPFQSKGKLGGEAAALWPRFICPNVLKTPISQSGACNQPDQLQNDIVKCCDTRTLLHCCVSACSGIGDRSALIAEAY